MPEIAADTLAAAVAGALACRLCDAVLPLGARPVFRVSTTARVLINSQAPGTKVHLTGLPFNDASGDRLREWLQMDRDLFYDESRIAILLRYFALLRAAAPSFAVKEPYAAVKALRARSASAVNACGSRTARSARIFRSTSMPAFLRPFMNTE